MKARREHLIGRTIVDVDFRSFVANPPEDPPEWLTGEDLERFQNSQKRYKRKIVDDPVLTLDDGRRVWFVVEETETSEYGVDICVSPKRKRDRNRAHPTHLEGK
jgi:hypothetical protein